MQLMVQYAVLGEDVVVQLCLELQFMGDQLQS
jgi:hypothetical protein